MAEKKKNMGMSEGFKGRMADFAPVINSTGSTKPESDSGEKEEEEE